MRLDQLHPAPGAKKGPKRIGRGPDSGHGKTSGKGQQSDTLRRYQVGMFHPR